MKTQSALDRASLEELAKRSNYNACALAALCGVSVRHLQRQFKSTVGCTPQRWLNDLRTFYAQQQLLAGEQVKHVAITLGFKRAAYFSYQFKALTGVSPSVFASQGAAIKPHVALSKLISVEPSQDPNHNTHVPHTQQP